MPVTSWNHDKPHRCPGCHAVAVSAERPRRTRIYTCCQCGTRFARWPRLWRFLADAGVRCTDHVTVRDGLLDQVLDVIADPSWRDGKLGWEAARDAVTCLKNGTHPSQHVERAEFEADHQ